MNKYVCDRQEVLRTMEALIHEIEQERHATADPSRRAEPDHLQMVLKGARAWAEVMEPLLHEDADAELVYSSTDKVISATQAALETYQEKEADPGRPDSHKLLRYA